MGVLIMKKVILCLLIVMLCGMTSGLGFCEGAASDAGIAPENVTTGGDMMIDGSVYKSVRRLGMVSVPEYKILAGMKLNIELKGEGRLGSPGVTSRVSPDGTIRYPYVGEVNVAGLTEDEAARKLEGLLEKDFIRSPKIIIQVVESPGYYMLGEIKKPGHYSLQPDKQTTLVEALALAGGMSRTSGLFNQEWAVVKIIRTEGVFRVEYTFDAKAINDAFVLHPDDIVIYEYGKWADEGHYYIFGQVRNPGKYPVVADMFSAARIQNEQGDFQISGQIVLGASNVMDAIIVAGGFTEMADMNSVRLKRVVDGRTVVKRVPVGYMFKTGNLSRNADLKDGDVISVPESWF